MTLQLLQASISHVHVQCRITLIAVGDTTCFILVDEYLQTSQTLSCVYGTEHYVCVYMCVYMYISYRCMYIQVCMYVCMYVLCIHVHVCMHVCMYACTDIHVQSISHELYTEHCHNIVSKIVTRL